MADEAALTQQIGAFALEKRLDRALAAFAELERRGLTPTLYTYSNLLNAHVMAGDICGAEALLRRLPAAGLAPNTVMYTTLLKGYCAVGDLAAGRRLLRTMASAPLPSRPDARTASTFLRGCVRAGDVGAARWAWRRLPEWRVVPEPPASLALARLLAQGLRVGELKALCESLGGGGGGGGGGGAHEAASRGTRNPCVFWERGRCERGRNCKFYHDARHAQLDEAQRAAEARDAEAEARLHLAHAAALLGREALCARALDRAAALLARDEPADERDMKKLRRHELRRDVARVRQYAEAKSSRRGEAEALGAYLRRSLLFSARLDQPHAPCSRPAAARRLLDGLERSFGLRRAQRRGLVDADDVARALRRAVSARGRLRWARIFGDELPLKMEICSGTGDWVAAQAKADVGKGNWAALELRHDRVYSIFSRMVLGGVPNLCVIGGDAAGVVAQHTKPRSVAHAFINFPEPPDRQGDEAADTSLHLLTPAFFCSLHRTLTPRGRLTIFSDNGRYCRTLAATLGTLQRADGRKLFACPALEEHAALRRERIEGVTLHHGVPGPEAGHLCYEQSFFDRFWEARGQSGDLNGTWRFFILLEKVDV